MSFTAAVGSVIPVQYRPIVKQFTKFAITGSIGAVVDFSIYALLTRVVGWTSVYFLLGQQIVAANNVSVFCAIVSNFLLNKYWTFRYGEGSFAKQWLGYFVLNIFTWALNQLLMSFFTFRVPLFTQLFGDQRDFAAKIVAIGLVLIVNYLGSRFIVFRKASNTQTN